MEQELRPDQIRPLADAIGNAFNMAELDGIVLQSTGEGLFKAWVGEGYPHQVTAYKLLNALEEPGLVRLFLANVLHRNPRFAGPDRKSVPGGAHHTNRDTQSGP